MMFKKIILFCGMVMIGVFAGCSALDHDSKEELAADFVGAAVDGDEEALWEAFAPDSQRELILMFGEDEEQAKAEILKAVQEGLVRRYQSGSLEKFAENKELFQRAIQDLLAGSGEKFVEIDGQWFIRH